MKITDQNQRVLAEVSTLEEALKIIKLNGEKWRQTNTDTNLFVKVKTFVFEIGSTGLATLVSA